VLLGALQLDLGRLLGEVRVDGGVLHVDQRVGRVDPRLRERVLGVLLALDAVDEVQLRVLDPLDRVGLRRLRVLDPLDRVDLSLLGVLDLLDEVELVLARVGDVLGRRRDRVFRPSCALGRRRQRVLGRGDGARGGFLGELRRRHLGVGRRERLLRGRDGLLVGGDLLRGGLGRGAGVEQRLDRGLLVGGEHDADAAERGHAGERVLEGLADLLRGGVHVLVHRRREVEGGLRRPVEDVVALAGLVADVREREQQVLAALDRRLVDAALVLQRLGELLDLLGADVGGAARRLQDRPGLRGDLLLLLPALVAGVEGDAEPDDRAAGDDLRDAAEARDRLRGLVDGAARLQRRLFERADVAEPADDEFVPHSAVTSVLLAQPFVEGGPLGGPEPPHVVWEDVQLQVGGVPGRARRLEGPLWL
jgi:hypothetical protein